MNDVFISYNSHDVDIAVEIAEMLKKNNISVWIAPLNINGGIHYAKQITPEIRNCKIFVLISSKYSIGKKGEEEGSNEVLNEIQLANNYKKLILPVKLDDSLEGENKLDEIDYLLARAQWIDFSKNKNIELVIASIKSLLEKSDVFLEEIEKIREETKKKIEKDKIKNILSLMKNDKLLKVNEIFDYKFEFYLEEINLLKVISKFLSSNIYNLTSSEIDEILETLNSYEYKNYKNFTLSIFLQCLLKELYFKEKGMYDKTNCNQNFDIDEIDISIIKILEKIDGVEDIIIDFI